ncbi:MAG TPA: hypothetical protein VGN16_10300 [Acidobacteriaceae bacterium]|jgi:hypothetical protein
MAYSSPMNSIGAIQHALEALLHSESFGLWIAIAVGAWIWAWWNRRGHRLLLQEAASWPTQSARVIWAQVIQEKSSGEGSSRSWSVLVTYSYLAKEVEVGEYRHVFSDELDASAWSSSLHEKTLTVHVDPADPRRSVWMESAALENIGEAIATTPPNEGEPLTGIAEFVRLFTLLGSVIGFLLSVWAQITALLRKPFLGAKTNTAGFFAMHIAAIVCSLAADMVLKARFPGRRSRPFGRRLADPAVGPLMKVLSFYGICVFLIFWARAFFGFETDAWRGGAVMFSAIWAIFFGGSAAICWSAGRGVPARNELAPKGDQSSRLSSSSKAQHYE